MVGESSLSGEQISSPYTFMGESMAGIYEDKGRGRCPRVSLETLEKRICNIGHSYPIEPKLLLLFVPPPTLSHSPLA